MDEFKTEKWTLEDGRRAERRVTENTSGDGQAERVIELHVEDERPMRLQQRVVEKSKPIVYERKVETVDPATGNVVDQKVESIESKVQMQLVEHISTGSNNVVSAQSVVDDCDCNVTRKEMLDTIVEAIKTIKNSDTSFVVNAQSVPNKTNFSGRLNSLGLADEIAGRVESNSVSIFEKCMYGFIAVLIFALCYMVFAL